MNDELAAEIAAHAHGKVPRELRRRQVLAEARAVFEERGYDATSMDELARRVGVSKPVVYDLVGSKEALFRDVMSVVADELSLRVAEAVASEPDRSRQLRAGILAFLRFIETRRAAWLALLAPDAGPAGAEVLAVRRQQAELVAAMIVAGGTDDGAPVDPAGAAVVARAINGAVEAVASWWHDHPDVPAESLADVLGDAFSPNLRELAGRPLRSLRPED